MILGVITVSGPTDEDEVEKTMRFLAITVLNIQILVDGARH
jgi:hypothetical protein